MHGYFYTFIFSEQIVLIILNFIAYQPLGIIENVFILFNFCKAIV